MTPAASPEPAAVRIEPTCDPAAVEQILRALPEWFGIEDAIGEYARDATQLPGYQATVDGRTAGIALVRQHFPESAELHLIAVAPEHHRSGIGGALLQAIEDDLRASGTRVLAVHTVGSSFSSRPYAETRNFYLRSGFIPLQEFDRIDWDGPTLVLVKSLGS